MAFTGLSSNEHFTKNEIQEDVSRMLVALAPKERTILDFLGEPATFAAQIKHEWFDDYQFPNKIVNSSAINSATANTAIAINGLGLALTVGTLLENESAAPELMQVVSIVGADSIVVSRSYDVATNGAVGSLAVGQNIIVRGYAGLEGEDHSGSSVRRHGDRKSNTVGLFKAELSASGTDLAIQSGLYGMSSYANQLSKAVTQMYWSLEREVLAGKLNASNSLGSSSATRTMKGLRSWIGSGTVNSAITAASFTANPHTYIGDFWKAVYDNGASAYSESWAIVAGTTFFRDISNLNDTKVQDSNDREVYKRVIRTYTGPLGTAEVLLGRALQDKELLLIPRERIRVLPLQGRSFDVKQMATTGDNEKSMVVGEYTLEVNHEAAMARITA